MLTLTSFRYAVASFALILVVATSASTQKGSIDWPGESTEWKGFTKHAFEFQGRAAYVVEPESRAPGNPWVWRARFPNFHAEADLLLLKRGFTIAYVNTDGMLGSSQAMEIWDTFYQFVTARGLASKCCLEGVSRGGLFVYGFASRWPDRVACIYCDTPVCDISSWPGGKGTGRGHAPTWQSCLKLHGLTEESVPQFRGNPIDRLQPIAAAGVPILHIVSLNDEIVPPTENTFVLAERYRKLGGQIQVMEVAEGTEKSGGHHFAHPDPLRVADFIEAHSSALPEDKIKPGRHDYFVLRGSLDNCRIKFQRTKKGRVVFLGGSITTMKGWRDQTARYLQERFPDTEFDFVDAGISSMGTTPGAFRLLRDVFSRGDVDLLFEEAAVNDLHNMRTSTEMIRGMEGIIRHARRKNPNLDIVVLHFADQPHCRDYRSGVVPKVVENHERVAEHYDVTSLHLAKQVTDQIDAGQFDWANDFRNCHPSPFGHRIYTATIRRMLATAWSRPLAEDAQAMLHEMPSAMDAYSYDRARLVSIEEFENLKGFRIQENCDPRSSGVGGGIRTGFSHVAMLVGDELGSEFELQFKGRAVGLLVAAGPDAGVIEYSVDGGPWKSQDLFTKWSKGLHLPWAYVLHSELDSKDHILRVRIAAKSHPESSGAACRIVNFLVNE